MSPYSLCAVLALLLHSTSAQGTCTEPQLSEYIQGLPNGASCAAARAQLISIPTNSDLMMVCGANCGRPLVEHQLLNCSDDGALLIAISCIQTDGTSTLGDYCHSSFPGQPGLDDIYTSLNACAGFSEGGACPAGCADALTAAQAAIGCCYRSIYTDLNLLNSFVQIQILSPENAMLLTNISSESLRQACNVTLPDVCDLEELFPGATVGSVGVCSQNQFGSFVAEELSASCGTNLVRSLDDNMLDDLDFDVLCTTSCAGQIAKYERNTCKTEYLATLTGISCLDAGEASFGDRCRYALIQQKTDPLFITVAANCIDDTPETCGPGCAAALQDLSSQMGCCYQALFNDTFLGFSFLLFSDAYTIESALLFGALNNPVIWDACDVPLIEKCQGEPFVDGATEFAATITVLVLVQLMAMLL